MLEIRMLDVVETVLSWDLPEGALGRSVAAQREVMEGRPRD